MPPVLLQKGRRESAPVVPGRLRRPLDSPHERRLAPEARRRRPRPARGARRGSVGPTSLHAHPGASARRLRACVVRRVPRRAGRTGRGRPFVVADGVDVGLALAPSIEREAASAELGYLIAPQARGPRGHATTALRLLSDWAFDELDLIRLELLIGTANLASQTVARRASATPPGGNARSRRTSSRGSARTRRSGRCSAKRRAVDALSAQDGRRTGADSSENRSTTSVYATGFSVNSAREVREPGITAASGCDRCSRRSETPSARRG